MTDNSKAYTPWHGSLDQAKACVEKLSLGQLITKEEEDGLTLFMETTASGLEEFCDVMVSLANGMGHVIERIQTALNAISYIPEIKQKTT